MLGAIVLGVVHALAWNFEFPSSAEQTPWRIASVSTTAIIPVSYGFRLLLDMIGVPNHDVRAVYNSTTIYHHRSVSFLRIPSSRYIYGHMVSFDPAFRLIWVIIHLVK
ncbi:hypothetical protein F4679DRAFT_513528 [Xylaria curta]|nr:hypothetical protein F4679DRAFT_513528 [Xylaria curta]